MSAPSYVPAADRPSSVYQSPPRRRGSWTADRPGEVVGGPQPRGPGLGSPGPDQGYALGLARRFGDHLILADGESRDDVLAGCTAVALRRASLFARAPVAHDVRLALELFGCLRRAPSDLVEWRRACFAGMAGEHGYRSSRWLAHLVPEETLRASVEAVAEACRHDWRRPLGLT